MLRQRLTNLIQHGRLVLVEPNGRTSTFGKPANGEANGPDIVVRLQGPLTAAKLALRPDLYLGEAYMDGTLQIEGASLWDFLDLCGRNLPRSNGKRSSAARLARAVVGYLHQYNPARRASKNVAHHYDLSPALYDLFLDSDLQYSCAYFDREHISLDEAQRAKKRHLASKLLLQPGCRVLDIGSGWGGLAFYLAETEDVEVTGVTLSEEQLAIARQRARERGLEDRVKFELMDYRSVKGKFDRIVSVGMFEHVGTPHYRQFFDKIASLLTEDGIGLLHAIGRMRGPDVTSAWIRKYIFPGGYIPALSEVTPALEDSGLWLTDLEILRNHYALTLRHWRENFLSRLSEIKKLYDDRFCRMWEFYLAVSEMAFRYGGMMVFQAQLAAKADAAPITRDYMFLCEQGLRAAEERALRGGRDAALADGCTQLDQCAQSRT